MKPLRPRGSLSVSHRALGALLAVAMVVAACTSDDSSDDADASASSDDTPDTVDAESGAVDANPFVQDLWIYDQLRTLDGQVSAG